MTEVTTANKRIAKNTAFLYVRMLFVLCVNLYTSRVVLNVLGVSDFGIYNVVAGFVSLFSFLNVTLASSLQRFYNFEGGGKGVEGYANVFSIGVRVHLLLAIIVFFLLETFGNWYINNVMVIPEGRLSSALFIFQCSIVSMIIVITQIPFTAAIIAKEKMDYYAIVSIIDVILKLVIVLVLPFIPYDKLRVYGFSLFCVTLLNFTLYSGYVKTHFKYLKFGKQVDRLLLKELISFSGWNLLGTLVFMLKGQGVNLLLNVFFGTVVNAARGIAFQINGAVMGFSNNISMAFRPQMVESYAAKNNKRTFDLFLTQSKICYCLTLMLIVPVIFEMDYLLNLWLGEMVPTNTNIFAILVLIDLLVCTLNTPVTQVVFGTGKIKIYQILSSSLNIFLLPVCWLFLKLGSDAWVVFFITIIFSIINQVVCLIAMHNVFDYSYMDYIKKIVLPLLCMTILVPIIPFLLTCFLHDSFIRLLFITLSCFIVSLLLLYFVFLTSKEKNIARQFINRIFSLNNIISK